MITAEEARNFTGVCEKEVEVMLKKVEDLIKKAAMNGERVTHLYINGLFLAVPIRERDVLQLSWIQGRVEWALVASGYVVKFVAHGDTYVPKGLANDDGLGPVYINKVLQVAW